MYYNFIKKNSISYIFGEVTWAHELLAHRLILQEKKLNCEFLNPHTIRIPNGRFAFFTDESQSNIKEISKTSIPNTDSIKIEKPSYLEINNKLIAQKGTLKHNLILIKNFLLRTKVDIDLILHFLSSTSKDKSQVFNPLFIYFFYKNLYFDYNQNSIKIANIADCLKKQSGNS